MEIRKHEAITAAWARLALVVGGVFVAICAFIGVLIMSFMGSR